MSKDHHADGQKDAASGTYNPPHDLVKDITTWSSKGTAKITEDNGAYRAGWNNANNQKR